MAAKVFPLSGDRYSSMDVSQSGAGTTEKTSIANVWPSGEPSYLASFDPDAGPVTPQLVVTWRSKTRVSTSGSGDSGSALSRLEYNTVTFNGVDAWTTLESKFVTRDFAVDGAGTTEVEETSTTQYSFIDATFGPPSWTVFQLRIGAVNQVFGGSPSTLSETEIISWHLSVPTAGFITIA